MKRLPVLVAVLLAAVALPVLAATPKPSDIRAALAAGNLTQAHEMIEQVLEAQPNSAQAHYVAAEVDARSGDFGEARQQLARAEQIAPGLPFVDSHSVSELRAQLARSLPLSSPNSAPRMSYPAPMQAPVYHEVRRHSSFPWGWLFLLGGIVLVWMVISRRTAYRTYPGPVPGPMGGGVMGGGPMGGPGYGGGPMMGGGMMGGGGGGIMGGLATGLAVGAGVAAGEELVHHMIDGGDRGERIIPEAGAAEPYQQPDYSNPNSDMGGSDFGFNNDSWGDSGGGGDFGGGGDNWS